MRGHDPLADNNMENAPDSAFKKSNHKRDWFSRLQDERTSLLKKIDKLSKYDNKDALMSIQLHTMIAYCAILDIRVSMNLGGQND